MTIDTIALNAYGTNQNSQLQNNQNPYTTTKQENVSLEETLNNSAVAVNISMKAQVILINLQSNDASKDNANAQNSLYNLVNDKEIFNFLAGKENDYFFSLEALGYEGKAISELNKDEANALISSEGFFGIEQTSKRVADFTINIAGDNLDALKEARKGIVKGFEEAEKLWNDNLPEISYKTQESTLTLIDARINKLEKESLSS